MRLMMRAKTRDHEADMMMRENYQYVDLVKYGTRGVYKNVKEQVQFLITADHW